MSSTLSSVLFSSFLSSFASVLVVLLGEIVRVLPTAFVLSWTRAALGPAGTLPRTFLPLRDLRRGVWHGDSHPGATIRMALRLTSLVKGTTFS